MYNLLIVDDEKYAIEGIKASLKWEDYKIASIYTALNARQARNIMKRNKIHILLCDIEMPRENGLKLLEWIRKNYPETKCIFLTCHDEFQFAQKAIQLGSFDYILKPVPEDELAASIRKATNRIEEENRERKYSNLGETWLKHKGIFIERFWLDILTDKILSSEQDITREAKYRGIGYIVDYKYLPVLTVVQRWNKKMTLHDERLMEYALKKAAAEVLFKNIVDGFNIQIQEGLLSLLVFDNNSEYDKDVIQEKCNTFIKACNQYLKCDLSCYIGTIIPITEVKDMVTQLKKINRNNVVYTNKLFFLEDHKKNDNTNINLPDLDLWLVMLKEGCKETLISEIKGFLNELVSENNLDENALYQFKQNFLQLIYTYLKQKGIQAYKILNDEQTINLTNRATMSLDDHLIWVEHLLNKINKSEIDGNLEKNPVEKAKIYITQNIEKKLTREEISEHVAYNPDYFNRIFKEETGLSIIEYILNEKIEVAKELLAKTDIQISDIALRIGYNNFSYFSKLFKKHTGVSPSVYRDNHKILNI